MNDVDTRIDRDIPDCEICWMAIYAAFLAIGIGAIWWWVHTQF